MRKSKISGRSQTSRRTSTGGLPFLRFQGSFGCHSICERGRTDACGLGRQPGRLLACSPHQLFHSRGASELLLQSAQRGELAPWLPCLLVQLQGGKEHSFTEQKLSAILRASLALHLRGTDAAPVSVGRCALALQPGTRKLPPPPPHPGYSPVAGNSLCSQKKELPKYVLRSPKS